MNKALDWINKNKRDLAVGGAVIIGNTVAGMVYVDHVNHMSELEREVNGLTRRAASHERVIGSLMEEDTRTIDAICRQATIIGELTGLPTPTDRECDENTQKQIEYWRSKILEAQKNQTDP